MKEGVGKASKESMKALESYGATEKAMATKSALETAYDMTNTTFKWVSAFAGPVAAKVAAGAALAFGLANVKEVMKAQHGADFVTDGPQMMMVGEGSGPERVQVTPLVDENINGPQGGNVTLNISGNVMTDDFVEDTLMGKIREGLRLGENMGI